MLGNTGDGYADCVSLRQVCVLVPSTQLRLHAHIQFTWVLLT